MKFRTPKKLPQVALALVALVVGLWPLTTINPIADDLHLLAQGSGLMRQEGFVSVLQRWSSLDFRSAHVTPLGGVLTSVHIWVVNQLSMRTPLSIEDAWGLARISWIVGAITATSWCVREILRHRYPGPWSFFGTAFVLLATIQVHGYWSNDPVVAFPVASWAFCILGFSVLGLTWKCIWDEHRPRALLVLLIAFSIAGVLTYELFLAFLVAASLMYIAAFVSGHRSRTRVIVPFALFAALPGLLLIMVQLARLSRGSSYTGTAISTDGSSIFTVTVSALLSALPGATSRLATELLPVWDPSSAFVATTIGAIVVLLALALFAPDDSLPSTERQVKGRLSHFVLAMAGLWGASTGVIALTPKYQQELDGVLGRVYVNYAPGWLAIGAAISVGVASAKSKRSKGALAFMLSLLSAFGVAHTWMNLAQIDVLAKDSSWSTSMLRNLESQPEENESRCRQVELLFGLPLPEYYQQEILEGIQNTYSGSYGIPYCNFGFSDGGTRVLVRPLFGTFPVEFLPDGRRIMWSNQSQVDLQIVNSEDRTMRGLVELRVSLAPCATAMAVTFNIDGESSDYSLTDESPTAVIRFEVNIPAGTSSTVSVTQSGAGCTVNSDPRTFWSMIELPVLVSS